MKLLQKMGYKPGMGLGRNQQGIIKPIEAKVRPKGQALGQGSRLPDFDEAEEDTTKKPELIKPQTQLPKAWKKKNSGARTKQVYKTAEDVLREAQERPMQALVSQPILDMRGPQARLVTNLEQLSKTTEVVAPDKKPMAELQYNLQLLVDLTEQEIQRLDASLQHHQDTATLVGRDKSKLEDEVERQSQQIKRVAHVLQEVNRASMRSSQGATLAELLAIYQELQDHHPEDYILYNIPASALATSLPRFQSLLADWNPLTEPHRGLVEFTAWRSLLEHPSLKDAIFQSPEGVSDPYALLVTETVLPPLRTAIVTQWQPRDPEAMLAFLEGWEKLLPAPILTHVLEMLILPKLQVAVENWEPRQETVPIHAWLHPWLPYLGVQLSQVYPTIRYKLQTALTAWHPSDSSALILLSPWQKVFDPMDWEQLLLRSIVPRLAYALQELVVNPAHQVLEPFEWVLRWHNVVPTKHLVALLETGFFPAWHQVLHHWLSNSPDYDEVTRWYLGWKSLFPQDLLDHERVRSLFNYALNLMNSAVDGAPLPAYNVQPQVPSTGTTPASSHAAPTTSRWHAPTSELTLKDLVQQFAEENNIEFLPKYGRVQDGLPVWSFGGISVVMEGNQSMVRAHLRDRWVPVSLERLLQEVHSRSRGS